MSSVAQFIEINLFSNTSAKVKIEVPEGLEVLEGTAEPSQGRCAFRIISQEFGDKRVTWDSRVLAEINAAKTMFLDLIKKGMTPFRVGLNGKKTSEVMKEFDPHAEEILFVPTTLVAGG